MSLAAESPLQSSSSSEDFAAFLDSELELASCDSSPNEGNVTNNEEIDPQQRYKLGLQIYQISLHSMLKPLGLFVVSNYI